MNKRILDATTTEMLAQAQREEESSVRFVGAYLLTVITFFAIGLAAAVLVIFDEQTILTNFWAFWGGLK